MEKLLVTGVAADKNTARISVIGVEDKPGIAFRIFDTLAGNNINVDIILQSVGRDGTKDISFTVSRDNGETVAEILSTSFEELAGKEIVTDNQVAKISVVGAGMETHPGTAAKMFEALYEIDVNIQMIATSEIKISVLIDEKDADRAVAAVHKAFIPVE